MRRFLGSRARIPGTQTYRTEGVHRASIKPSISAVLIVILFAILPLLGASLDFEADGQPSVGADGDDLDGNDDEDGVVFTSGVGAGLVASLDVTASGVGLLNGWVDLNSDGDWNDAGEQIFTDQPLVTEVNPLSFAVPLRATLGTTDTLPGELIFVSSTPGAPNCNFASGTLTCDLGTMAPTDTAQITIETVLDHPIWGSFSNSASVSADETDPILANNTVTVDTIIGIFVDGFETGDLSAWD